MTLIIGDLLIEISTQGDYYKFMVSFLLGDKYDFYQARGTAPTPSQCYDMAQKFIDDTLAEITK